MPKLNNNNLIDIIKTNVNILKNENKYSYILISGSKIKLISSSRDNTKSKKDEINFLDENINISIFIILK